MYISKIGDYWKILTDDEVKDVVAINLSERFKSAREEWYSKQNEEQYPRKVPKLFYIFLTISNEEENMLRSCN